MDQLICASLSHTHYWYEVDMLKVSADLVPTKVYAAASRTSTESCNDLTTLEVKVFSKKGTPDTFRLKAPLRVEHLLFTTFKTKSASTELPDLLNAWVHAIAVENWTDMAVIINPGQLSHVECHQESGEKASVGWDCMFSPMPHLCTFQHSEVCENLNGKTDVGRGNVLIIISIRCF